MLHRNYLAPSLRAMEAAKITIPKEEVRRRKQMFTPLAAFIMLYVSFSLTYSARLARTDLL